jgi:hypothetical protein
MCSQALYKKGTDSGVRHGCGRLLARAKHYGAQARRKWLLQASELHEGEDPARVSNHPDSIQNIKRALF